MPVRRHRSRQVDPVHQPPAQQRRQRVGIVRQNNLRHLRLRIAHGPRRQHVVSHIFSTSFRIKPKVPLGTCCAFAPTLQRPRSPEQRASPDAPASSTPPSSAPSRHYANAATSTPRRQTPACHLPQAGSAARKYTVIQSGPPTLHCPGSFATRSHAQQIAPHPTPAPPACAGKHRHIPDCNYVSLPTLTDHSRAPARCNIRSIRTPAAPAPEAAPPPPPTQRETKKKDKP